MKLSLIVLTAGKQEGKKLEVKAFPFLIGRDEGCHLRPVSPLISKKHCAFILKENKVFLQDFGSTNGSQLNGENVQGEAELKSKDRIKVGPIEFEVLLEVTAETKAVEKKSAETKPVEKKQAGASVNKPASTVKKPAPVAAAVKTPVAAENETIAEEPATTRADSRSSEEGADDDIAAMLLSLGDDDGSNATTSTVTADAIPDGSTVLDMPVPPELQEQANKDGHQKAKEAQQNSSQAARDILSKYMRRPR